MRRFQFMCVPVVMILVLVMSACGSVPAQSQTQSKAQKEWEDFDADNFDNSTQINNQWFPMKPGMQYVYEGSTTENGERLAHRVVFTITDLTKEIDGIKTVVIWDRDYDVDELVETELALFAQDDDGTVWHLGQYPEVYENGKLVEAPAWIHGIEEARAGITMHADPNLGTPSYSEGWGPAVDWTDRGQVSKVEDEVCVTLGCYKNIVVIDETSKQEPDAHQYKYYAPGVGLIKVGWAGDDESQETLELVKIVELSPDELAKVHAEALKLEESAYKNSKDVYGQTPHAE